MSEQARNLQRASTGIVTTDDDDADDGGVDAGEGASPRRHTIQIGIPDVRPAAAAEEEAVQYSGRLESLAEKEYQVSPRDQLPADKRALLEEAEQLAHLMDNLIPIPKTRRRIGLDPIVGFFPIIGDIITFFASLYIVVLAWRLGGRGKPIWRMLGHILLDSLVGLVPLLGDLFDALYQANMRNAQIIRDDILHLNALPDGEGVRPERLDAGSEPDEAP